MSSEPSTTTEDIARRIRGEPQDGFEGFEVRSVERSPRSYTCPHCNHEIAPMMAHVVVVPVEDVDRRRHFHGPCWRKVIESGREPPL
ncbi:MAG TPA: hypothetical protein VI541_04825 [Actinomycetota bacterium]|nr:hypothetical protein [Actinomycetota bacterium]